MTRQVSGMLILLVASVAVVSGQSADSVGTQEADTTRALPLPPLVVTGTKVPIRANKVGFRISVLRAEELEARRLAYAFDGLRELAGSYIDEAAGPGGPAIVRLRGGDEVFTQILLDGVQMNENGGFFDFQGLVLSNLDRVEVAKGPQSALYGSSAVSGVVQFLTPRGVPGTTRVGFLAEGGDASGNGGSFKSSFDASGGSEAFQYSTGAGLAFNRGIYALAHDTWSGDVSLRGDLVTNDELEWTGQFRFVRYEGNLPVRDPGATRVPLDPNARNARSRIVSSVGARFEPSAAWSHELKGTLYWESFLFSDRFDDVMLADGDPFVFDASFDFDTSLRRPGLEYAATYRHDADEARGLTISYGGRVEREELKVDLTGDFTSESDFDRNSASGFAEIVARPSQRLTLLFGSRWEKYEDLDSEITPRASVVVEAIPGVLSLSAAWGQAYKVPNLQQQFDDNPFLASNPDLKPETSESWEVGIDLTSRDRRATVSVTFFDQDFENLIREVAQEGSTKQIKRNLGAAKARGVEWSVRVRPSRHWTAGTEGAWVETEILDNTGLSGDEFPVGEELPFRPDVIGSVFVDFVPYPRFNAHVRVTRYGEQTVLRERFSGLREDIDSYVLTSVVINYQASSRLTLYSRIGNLFGVDYETAFDRRGVPINAVVGFKITN